MKRRRAIANIFFITGTAIAGLAGYEWFSLNRKQNLKILPSYKTLIAELAEIIIPATDTPGAKDARVEDFIIKMVMNCEDIKDQNNFLKGMEELQHFSIKRYKCVFEKCGLNEKIAVMTHFEEKGTSPNKIVKKIKTKIFGKSFFDQLKDFTVTGYCTSELGAKKGLAYDYIPVKYEPCIPLLSSQKSWATK
jgi:hypothetical protein